MNRLLLLLALFCVTQISAQEIIGHFGAGNMGSIHVTSSSDEEGSPAQNTLNGSGMDAYLMEASRFLRQATFGAAGEEIQALANQDFETWMDIQFEMEYDSLTHNMVDIYREITELSEAAGTLTQQLPQFNATMFNYSWWQNTLLGKDQLRQRMAFALSQILVISSNSDLFVLPIGMSDYYDTLLKHAFGNYRDLLMEVTLHPSMGYYLSHYNNPKANQEANIHPDENYAREIMQLFSIGLHELYLDGSPKLDSDGDRIPTYNNNDIKELARVFTGLGAGGRISDIGRDPFFGMSHYIADFTVPMKMYPFFHDTEAKSLLNGLEIPADQDPMLDVEMAVDYLFNHPNVGPFVARRLIQRFTTSNPTPLYIERVASVFNDNGDGERGDLKAVIKAILLDSEARSCESKKDPYFGKLIEPVLRYTQVARSLDLISPDEKYWYNGYGLLNYTGQGALFSPTVFNFYSPDDTPTGAIKSLGLVAPEYTLHDPNKAVNYANASFYGSSGNLLDAVSTRIPNPDTTSMRDFISVRIVEPITLDVQEFYTLGSDTEEILRRMDILLCAGELGEHTRSAIKEHIDEGIDSEFWDEDGKKFLLKLWLYGIFISPDFVILK